MSCESYQETLSAFLDGNTREQDAAEAFHHLAQCEDCRQFLRAVVELQHSLRAMPIPDVPPKIDRRIMRIPSQENSRRSPWPARLVSFFRKRSDVPVPALAGGALLFLCAFGISIWLLTRPALVPERQIIYVVSAPPVEVYGIRPPSANSQH